MKTAMATPNETAKSGTAQFVKFTPAILGAIVLFGIYISLRLFQQVYAWKTGLDSTAQAFDDTWMLLLKIELPVLVLAWAVTWGYLWISRDRHLDQLQPREELKRLMRLGSWLLMYGIGVYFTASFFGEQDAAWHQTVVRDTSFTPSHIVLFYASIPLYILTGVGSFLYAMTRLPRYAERISVPFVIAIVGPFLILPNLGYNEWGHAFWLMEEVFSAPLHWGFVVLGWALLAAGGILVQLCQYMADVFRKIEAQRGGQGAPIAGYGDD